jgi:hypothetical protein
MLKLLRDDKSGKIFYKGVNVKEAKKCVSTPPSNVQT